MEFYKAILYISPLMEVPFSQSWKIYSKHLSPSLMNPIEHGKRKYPIKGERLGLSFAKWN